MKRGIFIVTAIIFILTATLFLIRKAGPTELDDVAPNILCSQELLNKSDILWVIPKFKGIPISENKKWCNSILSMNKTLGLHGVTHEFEEFNTRRNESYVEEGIQIFEDCFGFQPTRFKPPQIKISKENKKLITKSNLELEGVPNQIFHKVYHCRDTGEFSNNLINLI